MGKALPAILSAVGSIGGAIVGSILGGPIGATIGAAVGGSLGGAIGTALYNPPTPPPASSAIKTSRPPRVGGYGLSRLYGAYILYETSSNGTAVDGYAVHDGPMTAPVAFYIGDDKVTWKSGVSYPGGFVNGLADGRYGDNTTRFFYTDGRTPGTTVPLIQSLLPGIWTSNHRGDGVCLIYATFNSVKSKNFLKRYPNSTPPASIVAQWQKCPDPWATDPCDDGAWTWTENPIRQLLHYILYRECPKPTISMDDPDYPAEMMALRVAWYNRKIAPALSYWRTASDVCDEAVTLKAGGTEARYRSCLSHNLTTPHGQVKAGLLGLCDGWMATRSDGSLAVFASKYYTPTVTIGPEHIISYDWTGVGVDDDSAVNEYVCSYVSSAHDYNSVECDAWRDEDDIAERGSLLSDTLDLQTPSWGQVRRLAKRRMARQNAPYRGTVATNIEGRVALENRYINLLIEEAGSTFYDGPAEITIVRRNTQTGGVTFDWVSVDPNIDAWNAATEEGEPAAVGDRVAAAPLDTPTITSAVLDYSDSVGGTTTGARIRINASGPDRDDLTWYARWKKSSDSAWNESEYSDAAPGSAVELLTGFVPTDTLIDVQVAYEVGDGRVSEWSDTEVVDTTVYGLLTEGGDMMITEDGSEMIEE